MVKKHIRRITTKAASLVKRRPPAPAGRITNETIGEHRERILAGGRRFKYPMQYARHRLVINTILLSVGVLVLISLFGWWQLYSVQNTSDVAYRVTQALPLPVASVDGTPVRYSSYLVRYRSEIYWLEQNNQLNIHTADGQRQAEYRKRQALNDAEDTAYAMKLAGQRNIVVSDAQVDAFVEQARQADGISISREAYYSAQLDAYGWSQTEVRDTIRDSLLRRAVAFTVDTAAKNTADQVAAAASAPNADFTAVAQSFAALGSSNVTSLDAGTVPLASQDPSGIIKAVSGLGDGQVTGLIKGVDGYYVAKLIEKTSTTVHYSYIKVALTEFTNEMSNLRSGKKVHEYITIHSDVQ